MFQVSGPVDGGLWPGKIWLTQGPQVDIGHRYEPTGMVSTAERVNQP